MDLKGGGQSQFLQYPPSVSIDRILGNIQDLGDLFAALAGAQEFKNLPFPGGEFFDARKLLLP